jgi:hypothetical protein
MPLTIVCPSSECYLESNYIHVVGIAKFVNVSQCLSPTLIFMDTWPCGSVPVMFELWAISELRVRTDDP